MRVVVDTNVIVSAIRFGGIPRQVWDRCLTDRNIKLISSQEIIAEISRVLTTKFGWPDNLIEELRQVIESSSHTVYPKLILNVVRDKGDDKFIEAAVEGQAEYIISGDKDLLDMQSYGDIKIITPAKFLEIINI